MNRTRKRLTCSDCKKTVRTLKSGTTTCLPCAAKGAWPWASMSKAEREAVRRLVGPVEVVEG